MSFYVIGEITQTNDPDMVFESRRLAIAPTPRTAATWISQQADYENREFYIDGPCKEIVTIVADGGWMA